MPARSRAVAVTVCWPSARSVGGVWDERARGEARHDGRAVERQAGRARVVSMPLPGCGSESWTVIAGRPLLVQPPPPGWWLEHGWKCRAS